jgi:hypothetical protein
MKWLLGLVLAVGGALYAVIKMAMDKEYDYWAPPLAAQMIRAACLLIPRSERNRYRQEWLAELDEAVQVGGALTFCLFYVLPGIPAVAFRVARRDEVRRLRILIGLTLMSTSLIIAMHPMHANKPSRSIDVTLRPVPAASVDGGTVTQIMVDSPEAVSQDNSMSWNQPWLVVALTGGATMILTALHGNLRARRVRLA